jgi:ubiquinone biosynthesis protein UbiJ
MDTIHQSKVTRRGISAAHHLHEVHLAMRCASVQFERFPEIELCVQAQCERALSELTALRKDAALGRFVRLHMVELGGGWQINQTFIPGAPSLEDVTDALTAVG